MNRKFLPILIYISFNLMIASQVFAATAPYLKRGGHASFFSRAMGQSCWGLDIGANTLPCNPGFIAFEREGLVKANMDFGNNLRSSNEVSELLANKATPQTIENLFAHKEVSEFESNFELGYWGQTWGFAIAPVQLHSSLFTRNPALPEIDLFASQDEILRLQFGSYFNQDLYWGVELRGLHRKFIAKRFFLVEILAQDGLELVKPKEQNVLFIDPSIVYAPENKPWNPKFYLSISDLGFADKSYDEVPLKPSPHVGLSGNTDLGIGDLGVSLDLSWQQESNSPFEAATLGLTYEFGILRLLGHYGSRSDAVGFEVTANSIHIGLLTENQLLTLGWGTEEWQRRSYLVLGTEI